MKYRSSFSEEWKIGNSVRQGGVLSGLFFCIYKDSLLSKISTLKFGCKLGITMSNIIAYADDIVLLAPSKYSLQMLINEAHIEATKLDLFFNFDKTKTLTFTSCKQKSISSVEARHYIAGSPIGRVSSIRYLGFLLTSDLNDTDDVNRVKSRFYCNFNSILRKFSFTDIKVTLYLFKQYCV